MKVLHVIPSLSPALGGPSQVALKTVKALRDQGVDAEIATTNYEPTAISSVPLNRLVDYRDVPVWFFAADFAFKEYIFSASLTKWLWQHISDYDILDNHYLFSYVPTCAAAIAKFKNIPYTIRTQGQLTPWALQQNRLRKKLYTLLIERHNLNKAAAIHCTTLQEAADLHNFGIDTPAIALPLGVEQATQIPNARVELLKLWLIPGDRQIVLFLSRLHPKKRPDLLIDSFQQVITQNPDCHLVIAGSGDAEYTKYLQQLVTQYNLSDRITFTGFVTGIKKNLLLQGADMFVLPSYSENFGIAIAEAMAAGLPVIVTPGIQIAPEIAAADAGIVVNDRAELITAMVQLAESPAMRSRFGNNGKKLAKNKYNWNQVATQLISAYDEVLQRNLGNYRLDLPSIN